MDARRSRGPRGRSGGQAGGEGAFIYYLGRGLGDLFCRAVDQKGRGGRKVGLAVAGHLTSVFDGITKKLLPSQFAGDQRLLDRTRGAAVDAGPHGDVR